MKSIERNKNRFTLKEKEEIQQREGNRVTGKSKSYSLAQAKKLFRLRKTL